MPVNPYYGEFPERSVLTEEEWTALRGVENAVSTHRFNYNPKISEANKGQWPSDEEVAARQELVRQQMRKMKTKNPALYKRLPLLHED